MGSREAGLGSLPAWAMSKVYDNFENHGKKTYFIIDRKDGILDIKKTRLHGLAMSIGRRG
jgi:hypothetical protein